MSILAAGADTIAGYDDLVLYIEAGQKPKTDWKIGTEHEKFPFRTKDRSPIPYEGPDGIRAMLEGLTRFGWQPVLEGDKIIGLSCPDSLANVSLEPGGQFELSGAPLDHLHQTCSEVHDHLAQVKEVGGELDICFLGTGFTPDWTREMIPVMPKGRYGIMTEYMKKVGSYGLDMMYRSCTVQVNLDWSTESDMVKKFRVALALQPIATALFANSPFTEGKPNGFRSFRSQIWTDTDTARTGMLPFVFEDGFSYERYVDYALDVPMYFVYRDGIYHDVTGKSFRDFMAGKLEGFEGEMPTIGDWSNHLTTIFPEVRIKQFMEMRGADSGPWNSICALPAIWVGLLYDGGVLDAAWDMVKKWTPDVREELRWEVPKTALATRVDRIKVLDIAREMVDMSRAGLKARGATDGMGADETIFLSTLDDILETGKTRADEQLEAYHGRWNSSIEPIYDEYAF
ncbi:MAG: glutamate--cysteine ligase [Rhodobiaceae bacterium]|nr:MAG: glutamate--cysteine ligase [Rhodobiaceae bacterium]